MDDLPYVEVRTDKRLDAFPLLLEIWLMGAGPNDRSHVSNLVWEEGVHRVTLRGPEFREKPTHMLDINDVANSKCRQVCVRWVRGNMEKTFKFSLVGCTKPFALCIDVVAEEKVNPEDDSCDLRCTRRRASVTLYAESVAHALVGFGDIHLNEDMCGIDPITLERASSLDLRRGCVHAARMKGLLSGAGAPFTKRDAAAMHAAYCALQEKEPRAPAPRDGDERLTWASCISTYPAWMHNRITFWLPGKYIADCSSIPLTVSNLWWDRQFHVIERRCAFMYGKDAVRCDSAEFVARLVKAEASTHHYTRDMLLIDNQIIPNDTITDLLTCSANDCEDFARFVCRLYFEFKHHVFNQDRLRLENLEGLRRAQRTAQQYTCVVCYGLMRDDSGNTTSEDMKRRRDFGYLGHAFNLMIHNDALRAMINGDASASVTQGQIFLMDATSLTSPNMQTRPRHPEKDTADQKLWEDVFRSLEMSESWVVLQHQTSFDVCRINGHTILPVDLHHDVVNIMFPDKDGKPLAYHAVDANGNRCVQLKTLLHEPHTVKFLQAQVIDKEYESLCERAMQFERPTPWLNIPKSTTITEKQFFANQLKKTVKSEEIRKGDYDHVATAFVDLYLLGYPFDQARAGTRTEGKCARRIREFFDEVCTKHKCDWVPVGDELGHWIAVHIIRYKSST